jgi:hypothetical protein
VRPLVEDAQVHLQGVRRGSSEGGEVVTHYIPYFTKRAKGGQEAYCGAFVSADEFSTEPTCPGCQAVIKADDETDAHLTELLNTPNPRPVKVEHFDPCFGYRLKGSKR